jgi:uncharacterized Zn-binding protein involved in type VI secretion
MGAVGDAAKQASQKAALKAGQSQSSRDRVDASSPPGTAEGPRPGAPEGASKAFRDAVEAVYDAANHGPNAVFFSAGKAVMGALGKGIGFATEVEQAVSGPIAKILETNPIYAAIAAGSPAAACGDVVIGIPHAHGHWPNVPPPPGIPLPHGGPILPIPWVSGAETVKISEAPAARCGDFFAQIWCGGITPIGEIFTGSATVWIESARASRIGDVTRHCTLADPGIGLTIGGIVSGSGTVVIGGAPMPSLTALAMQGAMHVAGKALGAAADALKGAFVRRAEVKAAREAAEALERKAAEDAAREAAAAAAREAAEKFEREAAARAAAEAAAKEAEAALQRFESHVKVVGGDAYRTALKEDFKKVASTKAGRDAMNRIVDSGKELHFEPPRPEWNPKTKQWELEGPHAQAHDPSAAHPSWKWDSNGPYLDEGSGRRFSVDKPGSGTGTTIRYEPGVPLGERNPSDVVLVHEMDHAGNAAEGTQNQVKFADPNETARWKNAEEKHAVATENAHRSETGRPLRAKY